MLNKLLTQNTAVRENIHREGELYKIVTLHGKTFPLYYGYYEECDRVNPEVEPMPIYPDFSTNPQFTDEGYAFVTKMQDACRFFKGSRNKFSECAECGFYSDGDELFGICVCPENRKISVEEAGK